MTPWHANFFPKYDRQGFSLIKLVLKGTQKSVNIELAADTGPYVSEIPEKDIYVQSMDAPVNEILFYWTSSQIFNMF